MRWNENLWPPGGFVFVDADGLKHTGNNLSDLISRVAQYRTRRGLPPGNPIAEVNDFLCDLYPNRCLKGPPPQPGAAQGRGPSLDARLTGWLRAMWQRIAHKKVEFVSEEEVQRRAAICAQCVQQVRFPSACSACSETVNTISFQLRAGRDKHSAGLKACAKFGTDLRVDVLAVQPPHPNAPDNCWKKS